jgi:uncharacterized protein (TIGR02246 family)
MTDLARLIAEADIARLLHDYCALVDANRQPDVLALFTDDAVYDHGHGRTYRGRREMATLFAALDGNSATSHHLSNIRIRFAHDDRVSDTAHVHSYVYAFHRRTTGETVHLWGRYVDTLVRREGRWWFRERALLAAAEDGVEPDPGRASRYALIDRVGRVPAGSGADAATADGVDAAAADGPAW